jgi:hypothetical protein
VVSGRQAFASFASLNVPSVHISPAREQELLVRSRFPLHDEATQAVHVLSVVSGMSWGVKPWPAGQRAVSGSQVFIAPLEY